MKDHELKDAIATLYDSIMSMKVIPPRSLAYKSGFYNARDAAAKLAAGAESESFVAVGRVVKHVGDIKDMSVIVWTGWQPEEGAILYTKRDGVGECIDPTHVDAALVAEREHSNALRSVLLAIVEQDQVELILDPLWSQRIAKGVLDARPC